MGESVAHSFDLLLRDLWKTVARGFCYLCRRLSNNLNFLDQREDESAIVVQVTANLSLNEGNRFPHGVQHVP